MNKKHFLLSLAVPALSAALLLGTTSPAQAVSEALQAQVDEAQSQLSSLYGEAEQCNYELEKTVGELNNTLQKIDETEAAMSQTEADLQAARAHLAIVVANDYKAGELDLISLLFDAEDFDDLVSRVVYASRVASYHQEAVAEVNKLQSDLEEQQSTLSQQKAKQEKLVAEQRDRKAQTDDALSKAESYYNSLAVELREAIAEEEAAAAAEAQRLAEAEAAAAQERAEQEAAQQQNNEATDDNSDENSGTQKNTNSDTSSNSTTTSSKKQNTGYEAPPSKKPDTTYSASAMVAQAYKAIGSAYRTSGYVWTGNPATSSFTCSGLVDFALGRPSNSSWPTSLRDEVASKGNLKKSLSQLNYGDLVFTGNGGSIGHVGIYVGGGQFLDSSWGGVSVRAVNPSTFISGGSIF